MSSLPTQKSHTTVSLLFFVTILYNESQIGHSGHILTTIPAGQHIQGYEMIDGDNTQQGDMVMVLQQQLIQMPRSEAYRLGYIHPNSIG